MVAFEICRLDHEPVTVGAILLEATVSPSTCGPNSGLRFIHRLISDTQKVFIILEAASSASSWTGNASNLRSELKGALTCSRSSQHDGHATFSGNGGLDLVVLNDPTMEKNEVLKLGEMEGLLDLRI